MVGSQVQKKPPDAVAAGMESRDPVLVPWGSTLHFLSGRFGDGSRAHNDLAGPELMSVDPWRRWESERFIGRWGWWLGTTESLPEPGNPGEWRSAGDAAVTVKALACLEEGNMLHARHGGWGLAW